MIQKIKNKIRLYINSDLGKGMQINLDEEKSHYLCNVLRQTSGTIISCFDGKNGEFDCELVIAHKKHSEILVLEKTKDFTPSANLTLLFAPLKKDKTDFIIEKSTELGVNHITPIITQFTNVENVRHKRYQAQAIEASEQCRRVDVPVVNEPVALRKLLEGWDCDSPLFYMDESGAGECSKDVFLAHKGQDVAILVGPEGGFAKEELELLKEKSYTKSVSLGPRILRAETAVVSALSIWQAISGDWNC